MNNKKAQVSTLILLIMIVLVFYILFLPASEREKLLETNDTSVSGVTPSSQIIELLSADVGTLNYVKEKEIEHTLPSILLEERSNAIVISEINPFTVRKGWFSSKKKDVTFTIDNPDVTDDVQLTFQLETKRGSLRIKLNNVEIFDAEVTTDVPQVVAFKKELLQKVNVLEFETYGTGIFAREYSFRDTKIVGDVLEVNRQSAIDTFIISPEERNNLASGYLSFYPVCNKEAVGGMTVTLNDHLLSSTIPNCNSVNRMELVSTDLLEGKNTIIFAMPSGKARLDSVVLKTKIKPTKSYIDYFNINSSVAQKISGGKRVWLRLNFVDDSAQKTADLNINSIINTMDQRTPLYSKDITSKTREGNNYLALTPRTELNVVNLRVTVE